MHLTAQSPAEADQHSETGRVPTSGAQSIGRKSGGTQLCCPVLLFPRVRFGVEINGRPGVNNRPSEESGLSSSDAQGHILRKKSLPHAGVGENDVDRLFTDHAVDDFNGLREGCLFELWAATGADIPTIQAFSGHLNLKMVMCYAHARDRRVDEAVDKMEKAKTKVEQITASKTRDS